MMSSTKTSAYNLTLMGSGKSASLTVLANTVRDQVREKMSAMSAMVMELYPVIEPGLARKVVYLYLQTKNEVSYFPQIKLTDQSQLLDCGILRNKCGNLRLDEDLFDYLKEVESVCDL